MGWREDFNEWGNYRSARITTEAEIWLAATRKAYETAAKAVCSRCEEGVEIFIDKEGDYMHKLKGEIMGGCFSENIHLLIAQLDEPEKPNA